MLFAFLREHPIQRRRGHRSARRKKAMRAGGGCISCISLHLLNGLHGLHSLHSLHARLHSTPHDQTSARCGRWAAEASQEAACLLTIVGAAVEQANPGKRDYRAGSERPSNRKMKRPIVPRQRGRQQRNHQPSPVPLAASCTP